MSAHVTQQAFAGQRLSLCRLVLVRTHAGDLAPAVPHWIEGESDVAFVSLTPGGEDLGVLPFQDVADPDALSPGHWTWPPTVPRG